MEVDMADDKKKKYPWIKSLFKRKRRPGTEGVYAGPEQMNRSRFGKVYAGPPRNPDDSEFAAVYGGPDYFANRDRKRDSKDDAEFEDVYAGPEYFGIREPDGEEPVDLPEPSEDGIDEIAEPDSAAEKTTGDEPAEEITADSSGENAGEAKDDEAAEDELMPKAYPDTKTDESAMSGVYGGPDGSPAMMVYAGPEFMWQNQTPFKPEAIGPAYAGPAFTTGGGAFIAMAQNSEDKKDRKKAEESEAEELAKRVAKELKGSYVCKVCGARLHHGTPFCPNCGSKA